MSNVPNKTPKESEPHSSESTTPTPHPPREEQREPMATVAGVPEEPTFTVYRAPNSSSAPTLASLPDDYFNMTSADVKAAQATLSARTNALTNAPLQLRTTREAAEQEKRDKWQNTTIRVKFSDRTQLERVFPSKDKIRSVYAFVRSCLREDVKPIKFILYQPPKRELKVSDPKVRDQSLVQLQLAPSSVLLLRFEDESLNGSDVLAPLTPSILARAIDLPAPPNYDTAPSSTSTSRTSKGMPGSSTGSKDGEKKIPKWLKFGHKK